MTYYIRQGTIYRITDQANLDIRDHLPAGNYIVKWDDFHKHFFLEKVDDFTLPSRIYGDTEKMSQRILNTYRERSASTGVLLSGEKGSGKTLLGKMLCHTAAQEDIPTLVINTNWRGDAFNRFIQEISQECIVLFDEFEKVYDRDQQQELLTLLDGVFSTRKLFVFTCNDKWRIDSHMTNRPGRIFYFLEFFGLENDFIREYCEENLKNQGHVDAVCRIGSLFAQFNFDMLKALVEEMNRYDESPLEAIKFLNAKPDSDSGGSYDISFTINGQEVEHYYPRTWSGNPLKSSVIEIEQEFEEDDKEDIEHRFTLDHLKRIDPKTGEFVYEDSGKMLTFKRKKAAKFDLANGYSEWFD